MKRRAFSAAFVAALISALTGSLAWADNPHGTPPGQAANDQSSASVTASASASTSTENKGQAKKADESAAGPNANASATAQANAAAQANTQSSSSASSSSSPSADSQTKQTPGGDKFNGCTGTPNTSSSPGVKPASETDKWTCASAGSNQTKMYGNGSTAGQGVMKRGGSASTTLRGPGNSQPHMVQPCPGSRHWRDWHAVKSYNQASCSQTKPTAAPPTTTTSTTTSTSSTTNTSVTNNCTTNNSVVNNTTTNNSVTNNSVTNNSTANNSTTKNSSTYRSTPSSGVQGAQHSSSPKKASAPAAAKAPAASTAPATTKGVLGTTASPSSGTLPFTGLPLWLPALLALGLAAAGYCLMRLGRSRA
jgi:hypothetical protein